MLSLTKHDLHHALDRLIGLVIPIACTGCGREGKWLCDRCASEVDFRLMTRAGKDPLGRVVALIPYRDKKVNKLIRAYKFKKAFTALPTLQSLVRRAANPSLIPEVDVVAPVPLHRMRMHERGFNQSFGIARAVAGVLGVPCAPDLLIRHRGGGQQTMKSEDDRKKSFEPDTFLVADPLEVVGKRILLVDDVYTTGVTLSAAAGALARVGAARVHGFALAYGG